MTKGLNPASHASRLIAQIPARSGSKRVPNKNLRLMNGKPMVAYALQAALRVTSIDRVVVNTDSDAIAEISEAMGAETYMRPPELATDSTTGDEFTFDFIEKFNPDNVILVNPVCPLLTPSEIEAAIAVFFERSEIDTLITCSNTQMPVSFEGRFLNVAAGRPMKPTQENEPVSVLNFAIAIWESSSFRERYLSNRGAYLGHNRLLHQIPQYTSVKVSNEEDFIVAERLLAAMYDGN